MSATQPRAGFIRQVTSANNRFVLWISVLAALGGFLFGYDTGVVGGALPLITNKLHLDAGGESWVTGSLLLGAVAGAAMSGYLADRIGRRWTVFIAGVIYTIAAIGSALTSTLLLLGIARGVLGLAVGTASFVAPMYIGEHSPKELRGGMTALTQVAITFGILIAYLIDDAFKGLGEGWRWMFALGSAPGLILAISMLFVPETPRWLVEHGRVDEARKFLSRTRGADDVEEELKEIQEVSKEQGRFRIRDLVGDRVRPLLLIGVLLAVMQQIIGINTVIYYGATILGFAGLSISSSIAQAVFIGVVNLVGAVIAVLLLDRVGRRPPLLIGTAGSVIGLIVLGWYFELSSGFQHAHAWIALVAMMFYIACFEISLGPIFWVMIAEIFPLRARAKAMALCTMFNWMFNFFVSFWFLDAVKALGQSGTFFMYAGFGVLAIVFFAWRVPETKNRSLEQIEREVRGEPQMGAQQLRERRDARRRRGSERPGGKHTPLTH
ncbi:MAG TPA: sugar porter family MFS transporter [Solirubrobacteraceae bacterium]|jgi:sugar porter (SP) family MFS transporter|nr:sugar porter family MFS transporter [Solirubrobacteraceae bacterium]